MGTRGNGRALARSRAAVVSITVATLFAVAVPASAAPDPESRTPPASLPDRGVTPPPLRTQFLAEGFETSVPPSGWRVANAASVSGVNRWHRTMDSTLVRTGAGAAAVRWQAAVNQDERLFSPRIDLAGVSGAGLALQFWWFGNPFWAPNANFFVHASNDSTTWMEIWRMSDVAASGWAWRFADIDVSAYAGGNLFLRLRYAGINGADLAMDDLVVGNDAVPGAPANDTCAGAAADTAYVLTTVGPFAWDADNTTATADYPLPSGSCTGYSHTGRDLAWAVDVPAQHEITATMTTTGPWDDTLFLVTDCANAAATCLAGDNALPDGSRVLWANPGAGTQRVYLIASGYSTGAGAFQVTGFLRPATPVESFSWGRVKAGYR